MEAFGWFFFGLSFAVINTAFILYLRNGRKSS